MSRFEHAAVNSALQESLVAYRQMVELGITSGTLYFCTGNQFIYALGNTYTPVGGLGGIEPIQEESDPFPRTVRAWISAIDSASLFSPMQEDMFGRTLMIRHCALNPSNWALVSTPEILWKGQVNKVEVRLSDSERGNFYEVEAESSLAKQAAVANFNLETHWTALNYSGDLFFSLIDQVPLTKAMWGQQPTYYIGSGARSPQSAGVPDVPTDNPYVYPF